MCSAVLSPPTYKCILTDCRLLHELPDDHYLEQQLLKNPLALSKNIYKFVQEFPVALRKKYFPAFARVFAGRNQTEMLKLLIQDCQKHSPIDGFNLLVDNMTSNGWTNFEAIKFVIENHSDTPDARQALLKIIGTSGSDVIKFVDYLQKFQD